MWGGFSSKLDLKADEQIVLEGKPSLKAVLVIWLAVPSVFLIYWLVVYFPYYVRMMFSKALRDTVMSALGVGSITDVNLTEYIFADLIDISWMYSLLKVSIGLAVFVWFCVCVAVTYRHFSSYLAITDNRVVGMVKSEKLDAPLDEMVNVFVEQSIWGKLFNYGSVVVYTKRKSLTFKSIERPNEIKERLMSYVSSY